jgi:hydrogenase expression/formation protein HypC
MCLGIAGQIIELGAAESDLASVEVFGVRRTVNVGLVKQEGLVPGDWILIHVGHAIAKMNEEEARASRAFLQEMGEAHRHEFMVEGDSESGDDFFTTLSGAAKERNGL